MQTIKRWNRSKEKKKRLIKGKNGDIVNEEGGVQKWAFVAQWLEHWSSKPGVESSILSEGITKWMPFYSAIECNAVSSKQQLKTIFFKC